MTEIWNTEMSDDLPLLLANADRVDSEAWDGLCVADTQNRSPEAFVSLTAIAMRTERIGLGIGVSNPVTRHPALLASASAALQRVSGDRFVLGIGRGDSAAAHVGAAPAPVREFERYVSALRCYLAGGNVDVDDAYSFVVGRVPQVDTLKLASNPESSTLQWLTDRDGRTPLEIVGAGPKVLALAAQYSDRPAIAVGAVPERVDWAIRVIKQARVEAGRAPEVGVCAYVNVVAHHDPVVARRLISAVLPSTSRFSVMHGRVNGPTDPAAAAVLEGIHASYSMGSHGTLGSGLGQLLTDEFTDAFGIAGTPEHCVRRLRELADLGVDKFVLFPVGRKVDPYEVAQARQVMTHEVVPHFSASANS
ncbi:MAG TPA: LLM class flavin-dependent oxidoreductase [Pseudonocardia sp.]|jgi:5,10-methylenetetrahydromethanopterin reductase